MKKLLAVLLAALLLAAPAFAQTASLAGEWTMTKTVASGVVMSPEAYGLSMTIVLNPDGTAFARQTINGAPMEENGTWTQAGNTVTITSQLTGEVSTFTLQSDGTLLAMVDSSVGGKTAVDLEAGKNLAGAFLQPSLVVADIDCLATVSPELLRDSCGEMIKHGVLADEKLFDQLFEDPVCAPGFDPNKLVDIVARNVQIKRDVVDADEREHGRRQTLNLGHTIGHAIEAASDFKLGHGSCVAAGLCCVARASARLGWCEQNVADRIVACVEAYGLPTNTDIGHETLLEYAARDKKRRSDGVTLVVPTRIGAVELRKVSLEELRHVIDLGCGE